MALLYLVTVGASYCLYASQKVQVSQWFHQVPTVATGETRMYDGKTSPLSGRTIDELKRGLTELEDWRIAHGWGPGEIAVLGSMLFAHHCAASARKGKGAEIAPGGGVA